MMAGRARLEGGVFYADAARCDAALKTAPPHFEPVMEAVRDHRVAFALVPQKAGRFNLPDIGRPFLLILGDDLHEALGPSAFHRKSVRRTLQKAIGVSIVGCEPLVDVYAAAVDALVQQGRLSGALRGVAGVKWRLFVLIETRPEQVGPWLRLVLAERPDIKPIVATVRP